LLKKKGNQMTTYTLTGLGVTNDENDTPTGFSPTTLEIVLPDSETELSYSILSQSPGDLPLVDIDVNDYNARVNGVDASQLPDLDNEIGFVSWPGGTAAILVLHDNASNVSHVFSLGGDPLPDLADLSDLLAWLGSATFGAFTTGPFAPGVPVPLAGLPGVAISEDDFIEGDGRRDTLSGGAGFDIILGYGGNDRLSGGAGNDRLEGDAGRDRLSGDAGEDFLDGGRHNDILRGGGGEDALVGGRGNDILDGGASYDTLIYTLDRDMGGRRAVTVDFAAGTATDGFGDTDTIRNVEAVYGTARGDTFIGSAAIGYLQYRGLGGADTILGTTGFDSIDYRRDVDFGGNAGIRADLRAGTVRDGFGDIDTVSMIDRVRGTESGDVMRAGGDSVRFEGYAGNDRLFGGGAADRLEGGDGRDRIKGGAGADTLDGGAGGDRLSGDGGSDRLTGGAGNDRLDGGRGRDVVTGGAGRDTFVFADGDGRDRFRDFDATTDRLALDQALWGGGLTAAEVVDAHADIRGGRVVLDFGGDTIILAGVSTLDGLAASIDFL
jgi:Ca2+-binding RTX toxin-like protein